MIALVGLFWLLPKEHDVVLLTHDVTLEAAEPYGDCLTCPLSHYDAWEGTKRGKPLLAPLDATVKRLIAASEYEDWPRGRVVYDGAAQKFIVYADRQIFQHATMVRAHFCLPQDAPFRTDPHYRNSKRLPTEQPAT
ncbi:MAG: hypothetical protein B7Z80_03295 [Rhodospirillales bacterium 20-64-7]|nr:MAG: hypothetical protein B7Z80_03295 [Rhodospirillales bacterium 20-64-7]